jgi:hypothetical protein
MPDSAKANQISTDRTGSAVESHSRPAPLELPDYLPARMLNEFVYCPRLFFYEWVEGVFAHSADTVEGELRHEKLEIRADPLPPPDQAEEIHARSVTLSSETWRLIAKLDLIEGEGRVATPVDYKRAARARAMTVRKSGRPIARSFAPRPSFCVTMVIRAMKQWPITMRPASAFA